MTTVSVNISMQNIFIDPKGNYDLLYPYVKDKKLRTIIDVGAWWGPWSLWWHNKAQQIEIFEPNQKILPELKNNIRDLKNCTLHETALGDTSGNVSMEYETHSGTNHINETKGNITLKTRAEPSYTIGSSKYSLVAKIEVIDNGPGIPDDKLKEIFYPMVSTKTEGMGLGLTIAQSIIMQNSGLIECTSKKRETIFTIVLPVKSDVNE